MNEDNKVTLRNRAWTTKNNEFLIKRVTTENSIIWTLEIKDSSSNINKKFINHFKTIIVVFNSKKELLYELNKFSNQYNLNLLSLIHIQSSYKYKDFSIFYWQSEKWSLAFPAGFNQSKYKKYRKFEDKSFNARTKVLKAIDHINSNF